MDQGILIDNHLELIRFDPKYDIYISRRALKHFVESRKREMSGSHSESEVFDKLYFAIDNVVAVYLHKNKLEADKTGRLIYTKHFTDLRASSLRVVLEPVGNNLEVCSIHFQKYKTPP